MISFSSWILQRESSPHTRARAAAAQGLLPMATVGSIHGRSTASPFEVKKFKKKLNKKKRKKKSKVDETPAKNTAIDSWLKETDKLKDDLARLKDAFQKHKPEKPEKEKPEKEKPEEEDIEKTGKPEPDDEKSEKGKKKSSEEEEEVIE